MSISDSYIQKLDRELGLDFDVDAILGAAAEEGDEEQDLGSTAQPRPPLRRAATPPQLVSAIFLDDISTIANDTTSRRFARTNGPVDLDDTITHGDTLTRDGNSYLGASLPPSTTPYIKPSEVLPIKEVSPQSSRSKKSKRKNRSPKKSPKKTRNEEETASPPKQRYVIFIYWSALVCGPFLLSTIVSLGVWLSRLDTNSSEDGSSTHNAAVAPPTTAPTPYAPPPSNNNNNDLPTLDPMEPKAPAPTVTVVSAPVAPPTLAPTAPLSYVIPPYPQFRYVEWSDLTPDMRDKVRLLGYSEDDWNWPGNGEVEYLSWQNLQKELSPEDFQTAAVEMGFTQPTWDCWINHYFDTDWSDLHDEVLDAVLVMGWDETTWGNPDSSVWPELDDKRWSELTQQEQDAAQVMCWNRRLWDWIPLDEYQFFT